MEDSIRPVVLVIMDGWGVSSPHRGNAITMASTPMYDELLSRYFSVSLQASGEAVGLPWGEMGNSEVGHITIGGGKVLFQSLPRITRSISDGSFFENRAFLEAIEHVRAKDSTLHIMGLVSNGGIHSSNEHLYALLEMCKMQGVKDVLIHAYLDGRDTPHNSGQKYIAELEAHIEELGIARIATLSGRFWAMDRDNRWDRTEKAYLALTEGKSDETFTTPQEAIEASYSKKVFDEEFVPTVIVPEGKSPHSVKDGDALITFNFRADRCRQMTKAFILPGFEKFQRSREIKDLYFVTMTEYEKDVPVSKIAYPPESITEPIAKVVSDAGFKQLHVAETEKYAHVTFFFNGGREEAFEGEDRVLIPSPNVASYKETPQMSAKDITEVVVKSIIDNTYKFIVLNFSNADMVGHTGDMKATIKAVETIDTALRIISQTVLDFDGYLAITADHGNAEDMVKSRSGLIDKEHSTNPVPFILVGKDFENELWQKYNIARKEDLSTRTPSGVLADVAPTLLRLMGLQKSDDMTGKSLI